MEGFPNLIALEDRDVAAEFAAELTRTIVPFVVNHHDGLMIWRFYFANNDFGRAGEALAEVARATFV